jgi:hypothetical protein
MPLAIDHVVWEVFDLDEAGLAVREHFGLGSVGGGRHPGWGTANRIIPLGPSYLELITVVDEEEAARDATGRLWLRHLRAGEGLLAWCLSSDDIEGVAARLGLDVRWKWRIRPDGSEISWRIAGLEVALDRPWLPFFIAWEVPHDQHPGQMQATGAQAAGISWVQVGADPVELADWVGGEALPVRFGGPPRVNAVGISVGGREIVIS